MGVILAVVAILAVILLIPSHFERVKDDAVQIAGQISSRSKNEFTIDTYPYENTNMKPSLIAMLAPRSQENALKAIKYVNEEFGFGSYLYDQMMETTALMGLQSEENDNYKKTVFEKNGQRYSVYVSKKSANKATRIYCEADGSVYWEQSYMMGGICTPLLERTFLVKPERSNGEIAIVVIKGKPGVMIGLDEGIWVSAKNGNLKGERDIFMMSEAVFKVFSPLR